MRTQDTTFDLPELVPFSREVRQGEYLFKKGATASSLIIVTRGLVDLFVEVRGENRHVSIVESGQFLGEKALLKKGPFKRVFSAKARTDIKVLELSVLALDDLERRSPDVLLSMMRRMFHTATLRLDRSNFLIHCLRESDNVKRLIHMIVFFGRAYGRPVEGGTEIPLLLDGVRYYIDMELPTIETALNELQIKRLLIARGPGLYLLPDEAALMSFASTLSDRIRSGHFDEMDSIP